jgi:hypothetical protein
VVFTVGKTVLIWRTAGSSQFLFHPVRIVGVERDSSDFHLHQEPTSIGPSKWTAPHLQRSDRSKYKERLIECPVKIAIATNRKTGTTGTANSQQECNRSQERQRTDYLPRQQGSLSLHARTSTRDRSNSLHRKKSTLRLQQSSYHPCVQGDHRPLCGTSHRHQRRCGRLCYISLSVRVTLASPRRHYQHPRGLSEMAGSNKQREQQRECTGVPGPQITINNNLPESQE